MIEFVFLVLTPVRVGDCTYKIEATVLKNQQQIGHIAAEMNGPRRVGTQDPTRGRWEQMLVNLVMRLQLLYISLSCIEI
jgi:hypothetical protein